jgi:hypothetical protein
MIFQCLLNMEFWNENFETPMRAGLPVFFLTTFLSEPTSILWMKQWLDGMLLFERYCFVRGRLELIVGLLGEIRVLDLAYLVLDDEAAPRPMPLIHAVLEEDALLYDRMRGHVCAMLTRLIVVSDELLGELNSRHFFAGLLVAMEDRATAFKFDAMFLLGVAFQRVAVSEVCDFMNPGFVELLEVIRLPITLLDHRNLSTEMVGVARRLNELLADDCDLKALLYDTVPEAMRHEFEDLAVRA